MTRGVPVCTGLCRSCRLRACIAEVVSCPPVHQRQGYVSPVPIPASNLQNSGNPIPSGSPSMSSGFQTVMRDAPILSSCGPLRQQPTLEVLTVLLPPLSFPSSDISTARWERDWFQCNPTVTLQTLLPQSLAALRLSANPSLAFISSHQWVLYSDLCFT